MNKKGELIAITVIGTLWLLLGVALRGPQYQRESYPADGWYGDYVMYWLSAKNYFAGQPVYDDQLTALARYCPGQPLDTTKFFLAPYNTHPPPSILLALPFAHLSYPDAHLWWELSTAVILLIGVVLAVREVGGPYWVCFLPIALAWLVWADPCLGSARWGQPNFLLAGLLAIGWVADRRGYGVAAGVCVGLATAIKLYPGLVFLHFVLTGRWRALIAGVLAVLAMNGVAAAVFGLEAFHTHRQVSLPSLIEFQAAWPNMSINGYVQKLLDPNPAQCEGEAYPFRNPTLAKGVVGGVGLLVLGALVWAIRRVRHSGPDVGWAACVPAMLLLSPITWSHYFVVMIVPFVVLLARLEKPWRWLVVAVAGGVVIPDHAYWWMGVSPEHREAALRLDKGHNLFLPLSPAECVGLSAAPLYLTVTLFILTLVAAAREGRPVTPGRPAPSADLPR